MSDYSFMQSGAGAAAPMIDGFSQEDIQILLSLFVSNSMINASKYVELCQRNGITKTDVENGLKYEVFEFFKREDLMQAFEEIKREIQESEENLEIKYGVCYYDNRLGEETEHSDIFETVEEAEQWIEENKCDYYENIEIFEVEENPMDEFTVDDEDVEPFQLVNIRNVEVADRNFVVKMHNYIEKWETWEPKTPLQNILKNGVDLINKS